MSSRTITYVSIQVDPAIFKELPLTEALKEVRNNMSIRVLKTTEITEVESKSRDRGKYERVLGEFAETIAKAMEEGATKCGVEVDLEGKSVAAVRAGLKKAVEKAKRENDIKVVTQPEHAYLLWNAQ